MYILIFMFLGSRQEDKETIWTEWLQTLLEFSILSISS
jgi:hypothetical protein